MAFREASGQHITTAEGRMKERQAVALELAGLAAITGGIAVIYWPAALILGGLIVIVLAQVAGKATTG